jgi:hypothetical protein
MPSLAARVCSMKLTSASWIRPVCGGFHNLICFNYALFLASCRRHRVLTVTCLDACRCAAYLTLNDTFRYGLLQSWPFSNFTRVEEYIFRVGTFQEKEFHLADDAATVDINLTDHNANLKFRVDCERCWGLAFPIKNKVFILKTRGSFLIGFIRSRANRQFLVLPRPFWKCFTNMLMDISNKKYP